MEFSSMLDIVAKVLQIGSAAWALIFGSKAVVEIVQDRTRRQLTSSPTPSGPTSATLSATATSSSQSPPAHPATIRGVKRSTLLNGGLAIVVLIGSFLVTSFLNSQPTSVLITSPTDGSKVSILATVQGTAHNVPTGEELWILIVPNNVTGYYPQSGPVVVTGNTWSSSARVGLPSDKGLGFTLIAALADQKGGAVIRAYFQQSGKNFKGLDPLPEGILLMSQVHVTRI